MASSDEYTVAAIGRVVSARVGREDDDWGSVESIIRLDDARFTPDALAGLDEFSHVEVIFLFDRFDEEKVTTGARHPRGNEAWPRVGRVHARTVSASPRASSSRSTASRSACAVSMPSMPRRCSTSSRTSGSSSPARQSTNRRGSPS
jgi:hypothetical protein